MFQKKNNNFFNNTSTFPWLVLTFMIFNSHSINLNIKTVAINFFKYNIWGKRETRIHTHTHINIFCVWRHRSSKYSRNLNYNGSQLIDGYIWLIWIEWTRLYLLDYSRTTNSISEILMKIFGCYLFFCYTLT